MSENRIKLLQSMPVFGAVNEDTLAFILERTRGLTVPAGDYFFHEGAEATAFMVLEAGSVEILRAHDGEQIRLATLEAGDCFGEMALIECRNRGASVRALEDCTALEIPIEILHALYERDLEQFVLIEMNVAREISRRLREASDRLFEAKAAARDLGGDYGWYLV
jgi:CRP-like cAMP-binding protein